MVTVDILADLHDEDETGYVWTFLDEARQPSLIRPGTIVLAGDDDAPAVAEVIDYEALVRRVRSLEDGTPGSPRA